MTAWDPYEAVAARARREAAWIEAFERDRLRPRPVVVPSPDRKAWPPRPWPTRRDLVRDAGMALIGLGVIALIATGAIR